MATNTSAQNLADLQAIKSNLIQILKNETAWQVVHGAKPSYQIDGKNVQWTEYRQMVLEKIKDLNDLIQLEDGPWQLSMQATSG